METEGLFSFRIFLVFIKKRVASTMNKKDLQFYEISEHEG